MHTVRKLTEYSLKNVKVIFTLILSILRYCCPKVGRYYYPPSGVQAAKQRGTGSGKVKPSGSIIEIEKSVRPPHLKLHDFGHGVIKHVKYSYQKLDNNLRKNIFLSRKQNKLQAIKMFPRYETSLLREK